MVQSYIVIIKFFCVLLNIEKKNKFICNMLIIWKHTSKYQSVPNKFTITSCLQIGVSLKISNNYVFFQKSTIFKSIKIHITQHSNYKYTTSPRYTNMLLLWIPLVPASLCPVPVVLSFASVFLPQFAFVPLSSNAGNNHMQSTLVSMHF